MNVETVNDEAVTIATRPARPAVARPRWAPVSEFPPRPVPASWPVTELDRVQAIRRIGGGCRPFAADTAVEQQRRRVMTELLLDWLAERPAASWQQRWLAREPDTAGLQFRRTLKNWLTGRGYACSWHLDYFAIAVRIAISADVIRPSLPWLLSGAMSHGALGRLLAATRDPAGFALLRSRANVEDAEPVVGRMLNRAALIMAAKGGAIVDITAGDVAELRQAERAGHHKPGAGITLFYRTLHESGILGEGAPASLRQLRTPGPLTPEQMIDRYNIVCRPVRDLLVDYLKERQPALDHNSLRSLANLLGNRFWADLEAHNPGISSLHLPGDVVRNWKQRLQTTTRAVPDKSGGTTRAAAPRLSYRECLTPVRAFYLDLAHWAVEDPARWAVWVAPCPISADEGVLRKATRQRKARMDARTRQRLPALPALLGALNRQRHNAQALLDTARNTRAGTDFAAATGAVFTRHRRTDGVWATDPNGRLRNLTVHEERAFWVWVIVEVLRTTGVRIEELLELTHHSLVQYRLPTTGELIPLLQIAPSKTDKERLLVVSPELADVLAQLINRVRGANGAVPLVSGYDDYERIWLPPAPRLFQRRVDGENHVFAHSTVLKMLNAAVNDTGLINPLDGQPLRFTPHDFRRMFITDAILNGLPPHIAQVIAGHQDIKVTLGYKAVYPDEAIQGHLAFLARRRALRPSDEYRTPTDEEWQEFLGHWQRRKVSIGTCARAFATPCIHEHACVRCAMLMPDPDQHTRLTEIRDNLLDRIAEAEREGWLGEIEGLRISLAGAHAKLAQLNHRPPTINLGMPATPAPHT